MITTFQRIIDRHRTWLFLLLLVIIIIPFVFMDYSGFSGANAQGPGTTATIFGHKVSPRDLDQARRRFMLNIQMSGADLQKMEKSQSWLTEQVLRSMVMVEKAERMGFLAIDPEVISETRQIFTDKSGQFSQAAYDNFVLERLPRMGMSESDFETLIRERIMLRKLMTTVASTAKVTPKQVSTLVTEVTDKITASSFRFEFTEYMGQVKPTDAEVQAFYDQNTARFRTAEQARVAYVVFPVDPSKIPQDDQTISDKDLEAAYAANMESFMTADGKPRPLKDVAELLRRGIQQRRAIDLAVRKATEFTVEMVPVQGKTAPSFEELAKQEGLEVKQTDFFGSDQLAPGIPAREFTEAVFRLSQDNPVSDAVASEKGVYVIKLLDQKPSELPPFEKVRESVKSALNASLSIKMARETGEKKRDELEKLLASGKTVTQAATELKLKPQTSKSFAGVDEWSSLDHSEQLVRYLATKLQAGFVSKFTPTATGGLFVYVNTREHAKPEELAKTETVIGQKLMQQQQRQVVTDFEQAVVSEAGLKLEARTSPMVVEE